ncbi:22461_t:CDS:2, partial [Gigaspora rosea]
SVLESTKVQLKRKNSLVIECKTINHRVEKKEDIIPVVEENNRGNSTNTENDKFDVTRSIVEEEMNIDHQEMSTQKKEE